MSKVSLLLVTRGYSQDFRLDHYVPHCNSNEKTAENERKNSVPNSQYFIMTFTIFGV